MTIFRRKDDDPDSSPPPEGGEEPNEPAPGAAQPPRPRGDVVVPRPVVPSAQLGGRIVAPRNGETVGDVVEIEVQAAEPDGGVERIEVEYSQDGRLWRDVGAVTDEPYDLFAILADGPPVHVAVVRSWRLAQFFRLVLETQPDLGFERIDVKTSDTSPWEQARTASSSWNTNGIGDGAYRLRAVTVGAGGVRIATPEVRIVVDNSGPEVTLVEPAAGDELAGTVRLRARTSDAGSQVDRVVFEHSRDGEPWLEIARRDEEPWEAEWDVEAIAATDVRLRIRALDSRGHEQVTAPVGVTIANAPAKVTLDSLPPQLRGRVTLVARVDHADRVQEVDFQLSEEDGDSWLTVASATAEPFEAPFDTTVLADGRYELRASAVTRDGQTGATAARPHRIDNTPPLVRLDVPDKGFIAGTVQLEARAHDEGSGVESILIELRPEEGRWSDLARVEEEPVLEHTWDTSKLADGHYDLRVVARDRAGNARRPELVALVVDNTPPLAEIVSPDEGDRVDGIVPIGAEIVDSCSGLAWLRYEWARGDGEWHELPRGAGSVVWQTAEVEDGEYLLRVRAADRAGNATTSEAVAITIANEPRRTEPEPVEDEEPEADAATRFGPVPSWSAEDDAVQPDSESEAEPEPDLEPEPEPEAFTLSAVPPPDLEAEPEPEPEPEPESEPEAEPEPEQTVVVLPRSARHWSLWELDSLTEEHAGDDPFRTEERRAILYFLRDHAALDGSIPDEFAPVVAETFGDLLD